MARIAFIGLGVMGSPMARHLAEAGHSLVVYNRTTDKAREWVKQYGGAYAGTPAAAAGGADAVITCVGHDADLEAVTLGPDGAFRNMKAGALLIDHTTVSATLARRLAEVGAQQGVGALDAPVSGGQVGAENRQLSIMCGGTAEAMDQAEPIMAAYAARLVHIGPAGTGQLTKMVNQIAIAGVLQGLSEALHFAMAAGLDTGRVFDAVSAGAAQSWQMANRWHSMAADGYEPGFAVDWMRKDLGLALAEARATGATLPVTALVDQFYADVQKMGGGGQDTSALVRRLIK